jgi:glycerol-3-phosphate dehydrogenase
VFPGAAGLADRVLYTHTGVRPLPWQPRGATAAITRRHVIRRHRAARGLWSVVGGKLTTHRALAEDVLRKIGPELLRPIDDRHPTRTRPLPGALDATARDALLAELGQRVGERTAQRLWKVYGSAARDVAALAADKDLGEHIGGGVLAAELVHGIEREWAATLEDLLQRRCMAGLDADFGLDLAPSAAAALVRLGIWDGARAEAELAAYRAFAARHRALALRPT